MNMHSFKVRVRWTGNGGTGTSGYRAYARSHEVSAGSKPPIPASSDPAFRGDANRWNPEEFLVASLSACHQLWYLHLCAESGVIVTEYVDDAEAVLEIDADGGGTFRRAMLRPAVVISASSDATLARTLHDTAHRKCFIANSVNFPIEHQPTISISLVAP